VTIAGEGGGLVRTVRTKLVVTDGIGPVTATPGVRLYSGGTLGNGSTPVRSTWSASDPSGIKSYQVQRQVNGGTWSTVASATTSAYVNQQLSFSGTYRYRVRATDKAGNVGSWATGPTIDASISEQNHTTVHYSGSWSTASSSTASGGSTRYTTTAGASVTQTFSGAGIAWVAAKGPSRGSASVYVDGAYVDAGLYDRLKLRAGDVVPGPAIVVEMDSTTLVLPGHTATADAGGSLLIRPSVTEA